MAPSVRKAGLKYIGFMTAAAPRTNKILKIFEPTILPIAISYLRFIAATTHTTSSGKLVPNATNVKPIMRSDTPRRVAISVAESTVILLPIIRAASPAKIITIVSIIGICFAGSSGVSDLQKTLSNFKTGGNFGEAQLDMILGDMLSKDQYYTQFNLEKDSTKPARKVDFVVKIPDKTTDTGVIYLPIDSKFNIVKFNNLLDARDSYDLNKIELAIKEFKDAIISQAKSINEKYICPPRTTDFALMFLPSEAMYAECMSIKELSDNIKSKYQVVIVGPTTVSAILKSFAIGFRYMKISDSAQKINDILVDIKNQYDKFSDDIKSLKKSLDTATDRTEKLEKRTNMINKKLTNISNSKIDINKDNLLEDSIIDDELDI